MGHKKKKNRGAADGVSPSLKDLFPGLIVLDAQKTPPPQQGVAEQRKGDNKKAESISSSPEFISLALDSSLGNFILAKI